MVVIKQKMIHNIPILELVDDSIENKELPTVVFFHGWTNIKESVLVNGFELAKRGMRAILPEAYLHGERDKTGHATDDNIIFWEVVG
ncbi:hydrolase, partial [Salmonella enterica subsp. enterica serovar Enteritidis]